MEKEFRIKLVEVPANNVAKATVIQAFEPLAGNFPKVTEKKAVHKIPKTENFWKVIHGFFNIHCRWLQPRNNNQCMIAALAAFLYP